MTLRKALSQRLYGLGSIYLATLATGSSDVRSMPLRHSVSGNVSASGIIVATLPIQTETYARIQQLVERSR